MKTPDNHGLNGQPHSLNGCHKSHPRWEITRLRRASPIAWRGHTREGLPVHVSYTHGHLRIELAEPSSSQPGHRCWRDLLVVRPDYIELELELLRQRSDPFGGSGSGGSFAALRRERRALADWFVLGECKSDRRDKTPRMTFWRIRSVLQARDERLDYLRRAGAAGSTGAAVRVIVTALMEENDA